MPRGCSGSVINPVTNACCALRAGCVAESELDHYVPSLVVPAVLGDSYVSLVACLHPTVWAQINLVIPTLRRILTAPEGASGTAVALWQ